ncbi:MAG: hypothetical protein JSV27_06320 [Candidatus Bathyarchaeota archaeon]|nr:MAG: hypothetical protein JSV27_06320 [Candidatus Bathyarchaeota archaeon]
MTCAPLLLSDPSPSLRLLVLRELLHREEDDPEVDELRDIREEDQLVSGLLELQQGDGSWSSTGLDASQALGEVHSTSQALIRLGYIGLDHDHPAVQRGAEFLFSKQMEDGAWEIPRRGGDLGETEGYSMIPLQTAIPLRALGSCGYAPDPRVEKAYEWLLAQRLEDGAWPTGISSGNYGYVAGYRRLAHSRWGCRSNTTGALSCLALHPDHRNGPEATRALDLLLGRETREKHAIGYDVARTIGVERARGFLTYYARFDLAQVLDLCWRIGASKEDGRIADIIEFMMEQQGDYGLWEYAAYPQASRWVTFDLLRSLSRLEESVEWVSMEPRTPFRAYPRRRRRF